MNNIYFFAVLKDSINLLFRDVSEFTYVCLLVVLCIGSVLILAIKGKSSGRYIACLCLMEYLFWIYGITVFGRRGLAFRQYDLMPFWSYSAIADGKEQFLVQNIMNVILFIPVGFLLGCTSRTTSLKRVLIIGGLVSVFIEALQYALIKGFAEFDDAFHNVVGCLVGYVVFLLMKYGYERLSKRRVAVL